MSQYYDKANMWRKSRNEVLLGVGVGNYLGELGGGSGGGRKWLLDMEWSQMKFSWQMGYRYNMSYRLATRFNFAWVKVAGNDQLTTNPQRNYRNLSFKSDIFELSLLIDYYIFRAKPGHVYHIKGAKGHKGMPFDVIAFVGVGGFYFRSKSDGVALRQLSTEGQGLEGGAKKYSPISVSFPFGLSFNYVYYKNVKFGLDFSYRFTLTDYIDDASTVYYDNDKLRSEKGELSAEMADKSDGSMPGNTMAGSPRGNPKNKDHYFTALFTVTYNLSALKKKVYRPGGKHSFNKKRNKARF
ncbi:MAG: hypothetical protein CL840_13620 [Crocinitomicaceae bacterium]|nr:hypothetical protein [Crocinitomicaceae bacterium]